MIIFATQVILLPLQNRGMKTVDVKGGHFLIPALDVLLRNMMNSEQILLSFCLHLAQGEGPKLRMLHLYF